MADSGDLAKFSPEGSPPFSASSLLQSRTAAWLTQEIWLTSPPKPQTSAGQATALRGSPELATKPAGAPPNQQIVSSARTRHIRD